MSYYSEHAKEYIDSTIHADMTVCYRMFEPYIPEGGSVLDVGFGSARDMLYFREKGYETFGIDTEVAFVEHAKALGLNVEVGDVLTYSGKKHFDGIWACASLLHLTKIEIRRAIDNLLSMLKRHGILFVSMKVGNYEGLDDKGRPMLYVTETVFEGYRVIEMKKTKELGREIQWMNVLIKR